MKRTALKSDPAKVREWQDRSRKPLSPGTPKVRRSIPAGTRKKVKARSSGWCVVCLDRCGISGRVNQSRVAVRIYAIRGELRMAVHLHHVLPVNRWPNLELEPNNLIGICRECHWSHEYPGVNGGRIPMSVLPDEVVSFAQNFSDEAAAYLERIYPKE